MKKFILIGSSIVLMIIIVMLSSEFFTTKEEANVLAEDVGEVDSSSEEQLIKSEETESDSNDHIMLNVINGEVIIIREDQEIIETNEVQIYSGDMIITKDDSAAKGKMESGEVFMIGENSSIEMAEIIRDEKGIHIEINQQSGLVYHMGEHDAYFVNINDFLFQPIGTHFFTSVDKETGESTVFVASGVVRTSSIPNPDSFTNVFPSQQLRAPAIYNLETSLGIIDSGDMAINLDKSILSSFIENKTIIDDENERFLELINSNKVLREEYGFTSDETINRFEENVNKLHEYVLHQSIKNGIITEEETQLLVNQFNDTVETDNRRIDMSRESTMHPLVMDNQINDRQQERMEEERNRREEQQRQYEEQNRLLLERLQQRAEQQREENRLAQERAAQEAERRYLEQLREEERESAAREREQSRERERPSQPEIVRPTPPPPVPPTDPQREEEEHQREEEERQREEEERQREEEERQREEEERQREEVERVRLIQEIEDYLDAMSFDSLDLSEGVKNIDLSDLYDMDERIETIVHVDDVEVVTARIEDSELQIIPINPGEAKLLFKVGLGNDLIVKEINISVVVSVPLETAVSVEFVDTNPIYNEIVPEVFITKAENETYLNDYVLFWADEQKQKLGEPIRTFEKTGDDIHYIFSEDKEIPGEAKGILVFSKNDFGLSHVSVYTPITDYQAYSISRKVNDREVIENDYSGVELYGIFIDPFGEEVDFYSQMYRMEAISSDEAVAVENMVEWIEIRGNHPGEASITLNLYYAEGEELLASTTFHVTVKEFILPKYGPSFIEYTFDNDDEITFTIGKAEDESDIFGYSVHWSNNDNERLGRFTGFGVTGSDMQFTMSRDAIHATRILVVTYNEMGESEEFVYVDIEI